MRLDDTAGEASVDDEYVRRVGRGGEGVVVVVVVVRVDEAI